MEDKKAIKILTPIIAAIFFPFVLAAKCWQATIVILLLVLIFRTC